ncbi:hypothetical protein B0T25DRAFT_134653 [Lasiosphaeria hispida]|uniref:Uncharacterized protein n=1 Tax=Lasiosphaeria hispida TaxID=260671 RepID=A0AAJ0HK20_9PEZI|nr:hypothetical protein B0T25DRAFT_134653 [Lasiosphaeria hispida]
MSVGNGLPTAAGASAAVGDDVDNDNINNPLSLAMGEDPAPQYNWFGRFDYNWFNSAGTLELASVPYFETVPEQLNNILATASTRRPLRLGFALGDCTTVFGSGTGTTVGVERNCTAACADPNLLFTPANLRVCTALAGAALLVQNGTYQIDRADRVTAETMNAWLVPELAAFDGVGVLRRVVGECIPESCVVPGLGRCVDDVRELAGIEVGVGNLGVIAARLGRYCEEVEVGLSADIVGPGVLLSYFLQSSLAMLFYLLLRASTSWMRRLNGFLTRRNDDKQIPSRNNNENNNGNNNNDDNVDNNERRTRTRNRRRTPFQGKVSNLRHKLSHSRFVDAVTSSLVEFQEAQVYFLASVQLATLVSYNPDIGRGENDGSEDGIVTTTATTSSSGRVTDTSYAAVILNAGLAALLNTTSVACVLLVQFCLQRARMRWWYTLCLMTVSLVFVVVIFARRNKLAPPASGLWAQWRENVPLSGCGGNPSPMTFCRPPRETSFLDNAVTGYVMCGVGAVVWLGLVADQLAFSLHKMERRSGGGGGLGWKKSKGRGGFMKDSVPAWLKKENKVWRCLITGYWLVVEISLPLLVGYHMSVLVLVLKGAGIVGNAGSWSFGQIVAVMIWAPTTAKFIYYNTFGIKSGFEERIAKTHSIKREKIEAEVAEADNARL